MPDVLRLRSRLRVALISPLAGAVLGFACSPPPPPKAPSCPSGSFCGHIADVEPLRQTAEGALGCPKYVTWSQDAGPPADAGLPSFAEASLDMESTRKHRAAGETDACCYHWYQSCPKEARPAGSSAQ